MHGGEFGAQHLDRHLPVVPEIVGQVHGRHAALAELALDAVPVGERVGQLGRNHGHDNTSRGGAATAKLMNRNPLECALK